MHAGFSATPVGPYTHYLAEKGQLQTFHEDYTQRSAIGWIADCRDSPLASEDFEDSYIGRRAVEWIENAPDDFPWHYFVSFVGPHDPYDPPAEYGERYRGAAMPPGRGGRRTFVPRGCREAHWRLLSRSETSARVDSVGTSSLNTAASLSKIRAAMRAPAGCGRQAPNRLVFGVAPPWFLGYHPGRKCGRGVLAATAKTTQKNVKVGPSFINSKRNDPAHARGVRT